MLQQSSVDVYIHVGSDELGNKGKEENKEGRRWR